MLIAPMEIVSKSWSLYKNNFKKIGPYMLLFFLPSAVLSLMGASFDYLSQILPITGMANSGTIAIAIAVIAACMVFMIWISIALAKTMKNLLQNQPILPWKESFSTVSHYIWPAVYTSFFVALIVLGGTILLIIPGLIFSIWYCFSYYSVIFDEKKGGEALKHSKSLVVGRWWAIFGRLLLPGLIFGIASAFINFVISMIIIVSSSDVFFQTMASGVVSTITSILITPLSAAASLILYLSAKENPVVAAPVTPAP